MEAEVSFVPHRQASGDWAVAIATRAQIEECPAWKRAFAGLRKDRRYYELVEDTLFEEADYRYFVLTGDAGEIRAIQPFFVIDQDLLAGAAGKVLKAAALVRRVWPGFLRMRTLMIGCAAGEGHLDARDEEARFSAARALARFIAGHARILGCKLAVFKEFTAADRPALACLDAYGFTRIPSMPMTRLRLNFASFDEYMTKVLSANMRSKLRRNFRKSAQTARLDLKIVNDITPYIEEVYPLYLAVYARSALHFEKLTPEYLCAIGQKMPEKTAYFLWSKDGKIVAFNLCLLNDDEICSEYVGLDYSVAFEIHLYFVMIRDVMEWALANGYRWYCSTSLNYEPKYQLRHRLDPLDLYVRHSTPAVNFVLKHALRYMGPARFDKVLPRFPNYADLLSV